MGGGGTCVFACYQAVWMIVIDKLKRDYSLDIYIYIVDTVVYTSSNQFTDAVHSPVYHDGFTQDISVQV